MDLLLILNDMGSGGESGAFAGRRGAGYGEREVRYWWMCGAPATGGSGGGSVKTYYQHTLTLDGSINASAINSTGTRAGVRADRSISMRIILQRRNGYDDHNGGSAGASNSNGGGGGGRIAYYYNTITYAGTAVAFGRSCERARRRMAGPDGIFENKIGRIEPEWLSDSR